MRVNHNIPALNAWRQGTITQRSMSKSLERLSSGLRINRAADDAAGLAISEKMRAQIRGLDQATRNAQDGISLIQTAEGALNETHSILQRMRELSVQAANDTYTSEDRQEIQKEVDQLTSEIDRISATTEFNNKKLLDGSTSALVSSDKLTTKIFMRGGLRVLDQFGQKARGGGNYKLDIEASAGTNEIQKSDIFKVKHDQSGSKTINADSNISDFEMTGAPSGDYQVNTVDVSVTQATANYSIATIVSGGETLTLAFDPDGDYAGSFGNQVSLDLTAGGAGTGSVTFDTATLTLTVSYSDGVTTWKNIADGINAIDGLSTDSSTVTAGVINTGNLSETDFSGGTDATAAEINVVGQFQQTTTDGHGLVDDVTIGTTTEQNGVNASMYFEVTAKDDVNNTVTLSAYSQEYDRNGNYSEVSRTNIELNTTATNTFSVGNTTMTLDLADQDHFTVGDKFGLEVEAAENNGMDQIVLTDDNGNSKQWTFVDGSVDNGTHTFKSYYLDAQTGSVDLSESEITFTSASFTEVSVISADYTLSNNISAVAGDNLAPYADWTITESENYGSATAAATGVVEKSFTQSGEALLAIASVEGTMTANASVSMEVLGKEGSNVIVQVKAFIVDEDGVSSYFEGVNTYDTTANENSGITGLGDTATDVQFNFSDINDISVGDKATLFFQAQADSTADDTLKLDRVYNDSETGDPISNSSASRTYVFDTAASPDLSNSPAFSFFELDSASGTLRESTIGVTGTGNIADGITTFTTSAPAVEYTKGLEIGDVAEGDSRLYDVDKFWDASGNFILEEPQTIKLVQGNGESTSFTISGEDTFDDVVSKLNTAIGSGLHQNDIAGASNATNYASFVEEPDSTGFETVRGTMVIRSAVAGDDGEITFVGNDDVLNALSLTVIQDSKNNAFTVDVTNAHTGTAVAEDVALATNTLTGVVHENVDVEFAANTGIQVSWDSTNKNFTLLGGATNAEDTFVHLADRTMVLHIGANQKQDIGTGIGDMGAEALGVDNIQVTSNPLANDAIGKIDNAISRVSGERSKLGAVQNRLDHTINNLGVTMENLTAAESRIRDADMAKEMMEFTKLQILSQSANAMLSQANQLPNNVLQLLR